MDKAEVVARYKQLLTELGEEGRNVVLNADAALVVLGIRKTTPDLEVGVPSGVFKWLSSNHLVIEEEDSSEVIKYRLDIEVHELSEYAGVVCVEGVWLYSPSELLKQKRHLMHLPSRKDGERKGDATAIGLLEELIKGQKLTARVLA